LAAMMNHAGFAPHTDSSSISADEAALYYAGGEPEKVFMESARTNVGNSTRRI